MSEWDQLAWVDELLAGMDQTDDEPGGWWEQRTGAEFGTAKLLELKDEIRRRYHR